MISKSRHPITFKPVLYHVDGMKAITVRRDVSVHGSYRRGHPAFASTSTSRRRLQHPVVVVVTGYPDAGARSPLGCVFKDMAAWTTLCQVLAASGLAAVGYTSARARSRHRCRTGLLRRTRGKPGYRRSQHWTVGDVRPCADCPRRTRATWRTGYSRRQYCRRGSHWTSLVRLSATPRNGTGLRCRERRSRPCPPACQP